MANNKLAIALLILFISLIGVFLFVSGIVCSLPNAQYGQCFGLPFWDSYFTFHDLDEVRSAAISILFGTVVLDGIVYGIYKKFGKEKQTDQSEDEKKEV